MTDRDELAAARRARHAEIMARPEVAAASERKRAALAALAAAHAEYRAARQAASAAYLAAARKIK